MKALVTAIVLLALPTTAHAGCDLVPIGQPCATDSYGNTYRTEENLGGGYNTYRNGVLDSQTQQNLGGGWTETDQNGATRNYNYDPYAAPAKQKNWFDESADPYGQN